VRLLAGTFATVVALGSAAVLLSAPVLADPSLGNWSPAAGAYTINTTTLQLTGPGTSFTGLDDAGVATFTFGTVDIPTGVTITVSGSLPLALVANTAFTSAGTITGEGESSTDFTSTGTGSPGGPGGGAGGPGGLNAGSGPGAGGAASGSSDGAGGGGFGGVGAAGGAAEGRYFDGGTAGLAGAGYGNLLTQLQGGSGGGGATSGGAAVDGGGGGGAIEIVSPTGSITLSTGAVIDVDGGGGATGGFGASGGGSGGGILLEAYSVTNNGSLSAAGGDGGGGGCCGGGGAGGGGQIAEVYNTLGGTATNTVTGGTSYVRSTSGCCTGSPSSTQPDPTGAVGSIVLISPPTTTTATADTPSPDIGTTETLNATVSTDTIPAPPTGTVVFSDPGGTLCTAVLTVGATSSSGSCTYTLGAADTGAITATFDPSGPYAASTTALAITIGVAIPVAGANPDPLGIVSGAAMLVVGLMLLSLSAVGSRRRTFG
jgi:hypothetical protein